MKSRPLGKWIGVTGVVSALAVLALGCGSENTGGADAKAEAAVKHITDTDFDATNFTKGAVITNKWHPLIPGTQYILEGRANRGGGRLPHRVVFTVTDLVKEVDGVQTLVMFDRDYNAGKLREQELAFHAQDDDGNVWNVGEYPEEYKNGKLTGAPDTWFSGLDGARAGVLMRANPQVGTGSYRQGYAPTIGFGDKARVFALDQRTCIPLKCYSNVLVTDEWNPDELNDGHQRKFYAAGVGNIKVGAAGGAEKETLVLVKVRKLSPTAMKRLREQALELDERGYKVQKEIYGKTPRAHLAQ